MKRVFPSKLPYRIREDVRIEPVRFGKYIYVTLLAGVLAIMIHLLFGHLYLLRGEGFVYSDNVSAAIEADVRIVGVAVREGQHIEKGDVLFTYDSLALRSQMVDQSLRLVELGSRLDETRLRYQQTISELNKAKQYAQFTKDVDDTLTNLKSKGLVGNIERTAEAGRRYDAAIQVSRYEGELKQLKVAVDNLEENISQARAHYEDLLNIFNKGQYHASVSGIVTSVQTAPGAVLKKGEEALRLFHGPRYIYTYFDERSLVSFRQGSRVWVDLPGEEWMRGEIKELLPVSERLPDEFQPRFKPTMRNQIAKIEIDANVLKRASINTTVSVRKLPFAN